MLLQLFLYCIIDIVRDKGVRGRENEEGEAAGRERRETHTLRGMDKRGR